MRPLHGNDPRTREIARAGRLLNRECQGSGWRWWGGEQRHGVWEWTVSEDLGERGVHWLRMAVVEDYPDEPAGAEPWLTVEMWEGLERDERFGRRRLGHLTIEGWSLFEGAVLTFRSTWRKRRGEPDERLLERRMVPSLPSRGDQPDAARPLPTELWLSEC